MVSQYEVDKLKLLFGCPIIELTDKEARKLRRKEHKKLYKKHKAMWKQRQ